MKKSIKDMTDEEKSTRIKELSYKFYDVGTTPSSILYTEMQNADSDEYSKQMLKNLETFESRRFVLQERYSAMLAATIPQFRRKFEYETAKLIERQKAELYPQKFNVLRKYPRSIEEKHEQELAELKRSQLARKKKLEDAAKLELDEWQKQLYIMYMNAVRYLYR